MGFQQGLSGLNAASRNLDVIGNNIANANTVGFKQSRTEFADLVASSIGVTSGSTAGIGVEVATIAQQFSQGNITVTGNTLDVAINGNGFFALTQTDGSAAYTRNGQFKLDKDGNLVTNQSAQVMGYPTDPLTGLRTSVTLQPIVLPTGGPIPAQQSTAITAEFNLDAEAPVAATAVPPTPRTTYGTSLNVFDSQGVAVPVNLYFEKTALNTWAVYDLPTGGTAVGSLVFNNSGAITTPAPGTPIALSVTGPLGAFGVSLNVDDVTQFGSPFAVSNLTQDGYTAGELTGIRIENSGNITARYSNGQTQSAGQLALVNFRNPQGLGQLGAGVWQETFESGLPVTGAPSEGNFGALRSGSVEDANVDLTSELVNMLTAQRAYQANAQTIKTQDQVLSTLVNLR